MAGASNRPIDTTRSPVERCLPMLAPPRSLAPAALLIALLSGQAGTGLVLAHVASEHAVRESHERVQAPGHHAGGHPSEAGGEHEDTDHGPEHTHQIVPAIATAAAPARVACPSIDVQPCPAVGGQGRFDRPAPCDLIHLALPVPGTGPPEPQRHPILLL